MLAAGLLLAAEFPCQFVTNPEFILWKDSNEFSYAVGVNLLSSLLKLIKINCLPITWAKHQ